MNRTEAAWVRDNAWTRQIHKDHSNDYYAVCPCQYGPTGWCQAGNERSCGHCAGHTVVSPDTYVTNARSQVLSWRIKGARSMVAAVWRVGRACRWRCPCACHQAPPEPAQLALFGLDEVAA